MKKRKIASLYMLMAMTISACGNQTPQADLAEMQENDTITADAEGQTEYEEAAAEKEGSSEDNSIVEVSNSENNIVEITDYIGNFEKVVEIMDMEYDNEAATGSNNYCIDNFKLSWMIMVIMLVQIRKMRRWLYMGYVLEIIEQLYCPGFRNMVIHIKMCQKIQTRFICYRMEK